MRNTGGVESVHPGAGRALDRTGIGAKCLLSNALNIYYQMQKYLLSNALNIYYQMQMLLNIYYQMELIAKCLL